jgi:hypothetical protein
MDKQSDAWRHLCYSFKFIILKTADLVNEELVRKCDPKLILEIAHANQFTFQSGMTNFAHIQEALIKFLRSI